MGVILSLDTADPALATRLIQQCQGHITALKLGHVPWSLWGQETWQEKCGDMPIFLDFKFLDIPQTVARAIDGYKKVLPHLAFFTFHDSQDLRMTEAVLSQGSPQQALCVIGLSSQAHEPDLFIERAKIQYKAGVRGFICPPPLLSRMRATFGQTVTLLSPGIRHHDKKDDHAITFSPQQAYKEGADHLIVGRPIIQSPDPIKTLHLYTTVT